MPTGETIMQMKEDRGTKTEQVRDGVLRAVLHGDFKPGDKLPPERDMARSTRTSRITVRRAYEEMEAAGILDRARGRGTYLRTQVRGHGSSGSMVALLASVRDPFMLEFITALDAAMVSQGGVLALRLTNEDPSREERAAMELVARGLRDVIVWPSGQELSVSVFERLRILGTNMVFFDRMFPGAYADYVGLDNRHAIRLLMDLAGRRGRRSALFVSHSRLGADSDKDREEAFMRLCRDRALAHRLVRVPWKGNVPGAVQLNRRRWLHGLNDPAVLCVNDDVAVAVRRSMPDRVPVFGIDGLPEAIAAGIPTVSQPMAAMAQRAIQMLREQQRMGVSWVSRRVFCKGRLVAP